MQVELLRRLVANILLKHPSHPLAFKQATADTLLSPGKMMVDILPTPRPYVTFVR